MKGTKQTILAAAVLAAAAAWPSFAAAEFVTQSTDPTTIAGGDVCTDGDLQSDTSWFRVYDLDGPATIEAVRFGVFSASSSAGSAAVTIRVWDARNFPSAPTLLYSEQGTVPLGAGFTHTFPLSVPLEVDAIPVAIEVLAPGTADSAERLRVGFNTAGESAPTYVQAPACGYPNPVSIPGGFTLHLLIHLDVSYCGNGTLNGSEACDDGNATEGDGCDSNCTVSACGNSIVAPLEACDDGDTANDDGCDSNCTVTACGNGIQNALEGCDDGNLTTGDGCDANCTVTGCGNGVVNTGEACDDGNGVSGDGCDANCRATGCGNGVVTGAEVCDDGDTTGGDGCEANCTLTPACGDGIVGAGEACDDANSLDGDGCETDCTVTVDEGVDCGDGQLDVGEECDDGNTVGGDGCEADCLRTEILRCGDGERAGTEQCDDGNADDGDGCSALCAYEPIEDWGCQSSAGGLGGAALLLLGLGLVGPRRRRARR